MAIIDMTLELEAESVLVLKVNATIEELISYYT